MRSRSHTARAPHIGEKSQSRDSRGAARANGGRGTFRGRRRYSREDEA